MSGDLKVEPADKPSSMQHAFRISLNLTRRVVRRLIEIEQERQAVVWKPAPRVSNVPDPVSFQFTLRVLRRVIHRVVEQARPLHTA
jgi:hypothetical protein